MLAMSEYWIAYRVIYNGRQSSDWYCNDLFLYEKMSCITFVFMKSGRCFSAEEVVCFHNKI